MNDTDKLQFKKGDFLILLVVGILLIGLLIVIAQRKQGSLVYVTVHGDTTTYSLYDDCTIPITNNEEKDSSVSALFVKNTVVIENGQVYMESADCPDQVCVKHKAICKDGEMIICLPNEVFVEVESNIKNEIDN